MGPTQVMILAILFSVLYTSAEGNGIIKSELKTSDPWPEEGKTPYKHLLECDYRHNFPKDPSWTYTYDIHCIETKDDSGNSVLSLSLNYDNNVFDIFHVTSCKPEDVVRSVFPPKQKSRYLPDDKPDHLLRPTISYIKYKKQDGECFARKYEYENRKAKAAQRFDQEKIKCEGEPGSKYGEFAEFTNCRVPTLPLTKIVKEWSTGDPAWNPNDEEGKTHERFLECSFDQFSKYYDLTCVQGDKEDEYFAFVTYQKELLDRFTVTSCEEEDIVNGIFPIKDTTVNPKNANWIQKIWFSNKEGQCYKREYPNYEFEAPLSVATKVDCPTFADQWTNPTFGYAGQWRECQGPRSIKGRNSHSQKGHAGAGAADQHEEHGKIEHNKKGHAGAGAAKKHEEHGKIEHKKKGDKHKP